MVERVALVTDDGETLDGELATLRLAARRRSCCATPIPSTVARCARSSMSELFAALPRIGRRLPAVRFPRRRREHGAVRPRRRRASRRPRRARATRARVADGRPTYLVGWSFGADLALSIRDAGHAGWVGIALPLRWLDDAGRHRRRPPPEAAAARRARRVPSAGRGRWHATAAWTDTTVEVVGGASHFFVGRTARLVERVAAAVGAEPTVASRRAQRDRHAKRPRPLGRGRARRLRSYGQAVAPAASSSSWRSRNDTRRATVSFQAAKSSS